MDGRTAGLSCYMTATNQYTVHNLYGKFCQPSFPYHITATNQYTKYILQDLLAKPPLLYDSYQSIYKMISSFMKPPVMALPNMFGGEHQLPFCKYVHALTDREIGQHLSDLLSRKEISSSHLDINCYDVLDSLYSCQEMHFLHVTLLSVTIVENVV